MNNSVDNLITNRLINDKIQGCFKGKDYRIYYFHDDEAGKSVKAIEMKRNDEENYFDYMLKYGFSTEIQRKNLIHNLSIMIKNYE